MTENNIIKDTFILILTYEMSINADTGEILETKLINRTVNKPEEKSSPKRKLKDNDSDPKLYLEDSKYRLNAKAVELMSIEPGDKLEITYGKQLPQIQKSEDGNKVTKSFTVQFRGLKHDELIKYGNEFVISKVGDIFQLNSGKEIEEFNGDENVNTDDFEIDLDGLIDDTEINSDFFKL